MRLVQTIIKQTIIISGRDVKKDRSSKTMNEE